MKSSANFTIAMASLCLVFVAAVVLLTTFGKDVLRDLSTTDLAVEYTDLARQAAQKRNYAEAERMYQKAISAAREAKAPDAAVAFAMLSYSDFLKKRKRMEEASSMEANARELQRSIH